jgi:hypothetical protein
LYLFVLSEPPSWLAYAHVTVLFVLMGLVYIQSSRRGIGFMIVFLAMAGIFMVDVLAYIPFYFYVRSRDHKRGGAPRRTSRSVPPADTAVAVKPPASPE